MGSAKPHRSSCSKETSVSGAEWVREKAGVSELEGNMVEKMRRQTMSGSSMMMGEGVLYVCCRAGVHGEGWTDWPESLMQIKAIPSPFVPKFLGAVCRSAFPRPWLQEMLITNSWANCFCQNSVRLLIISLQRWKGRLLAVVLGQLQLHFTVLQKAWSIMQGLASYWWDLSSHPACVTSWGRWLQICLFCCLQSPPSLKSGCQYQASTAQGATHNRSPLLPPLGKADSKTEGGMLPCPFPTRLDFLIYVLSCAHQFFSILLFLKILNRPDKMIFTLEGCPFLMSRTSLPHPLPGLLSFLENLVQHSFLSCLS